MKPKKIKGYLGGYMEFPRQSLTPDQQAGDDLHKRMMDIAGKYADHVASCHYCGGPTAYTPDEWAAKGSRPTCLACLISIP